MTELVSKLDGHFQPEATDHRSPTFGPPSFYLVRDHYNLRVDVSDLPSGTYSALTKVSVCDPDKPVATIFQAQYEPHQGKLQVVVPLISQLTREPLTLKTNALQLQLIEVHSLIRYKHSLLIPKEVFLASQKTQDIEPAETASIPTSTRRSMTKENALKQLIPQVGLLENANTLGYSTLEGVATLLQTIINIQDTTTEDTLKVGVGQYKDSVPADFYKKQAWLETWATEEIIEALTVLAKTHTLATLWAVIDQKIDQQLKKVKLPVENRRAQYAAITANFEYMLRDILESLAAQDPMMPIEDLPEHFGVSANEMVKYLYAIANRAGSSEPAKIRAYAREVIGKPQSTPTEISLPVLDPAEAEPNEAMQRLDEDDVLAEVAPHGSGPRAQTTLILAGERNKRKTVPGTIKVV